MPSKTNYLLGIFLSLVIFISNKPVFAINNPDLLPEEKTPVIDLAKTLSPNQKRSLEENLNNLEMIGQLSQQNDSSYIDTLTNWGYEYYYKIQTEASIGSRYSYTQSNILDNIMSHTINLTATNNQYDRITLSWEHELNQQEFYAIEIWRTDNQLKDPINEYLLSTITDYNKNSLEDSYLVGDGIAWFYKLKLIDQFGNISYSPIVIGNSHP